MDAPAGILHTILLCMIVLSHNDDNNKINPQAAPPAPLYLHCVLNLGLHQVLISFFVENRKTNQPTV